jgi:hypothetical protein
MPENFVRMAKRHRTCLFVAALATVVALSGLVGVASALAKAPTGDFVKFSQCPRFTTGVNLCLYSEVYGGKVTIGKQTVPLNEDGKHVIVLQGGIALNEETFEESFVGALNGETLSKTPQNVPGGLAGLINCTEITGSGLLEVLARTTCKTTFENGATGVQAVTELARPASEIAISKRNLIAEEGVGLSLPVKVHLENPLLGSECYVGSSASPIMLNLTTGETSPNPPNTPIHGHIGLIEQKDEFNFIAIPKTILVNNEFSAPAATGCGGLLALVLNPLVHSKVGLPSPDGHNTAIQETNIFEATTTGVIGSEA